MRQADRVGIAARPRRPAGFKAVVRVGWSLGLLLLLAAPALAQPPTASTRPVAEALDRKVVLDWPENVESEPLFGGYHVWRSTFDDPSRYLLLRRFQRRYPIAWTYESAPEPAGSCRTGTPCRQFADPDSIVSLLKVQVTSLGDSSLVRDYPCYCSDCAISDCPAIGIRPFNGFPYYYAVTWFSECLTDRNDTLWVEQPQPEIFPFMRDGGERFGFVVGRDTLEVNPVRCRRIDPRTNGPADTLRVTVHQGTVASERALRHFAIESTSIGPVFTTAASNQRLDAVTVIPNPYVENAPWDQPGRRKIQFVNLTERAVVRIFTVGGDLVRVLEHQLTGTADPAQGAIDWDLLTTKGRLVESGIYIYHVETPGKVADVQGRLVIVR